MSMPHLVPEKQRRFAIEVVEELRAAGFAAYWAGGCVRDQLLGRTPWDFDVATDAKPEEIRGLFGRRRTLAIGAAFGVITVLGPPEAGQVEVTTFRRDSAYSDGRHPDHVTFSSPEEDARRRDFTINGMFYDPLADQLIDFVSGADDLRTGIVRAIGLARERFAEDKLRMLRAIRFATIFNFQLEPATEAAIREMAAEITVVSAERIAAEIEIMLVHANRARAVRLLAETGLLEAVGVPPLGGSGFALEPTLTLLEKLVEPTFALSLAVLLHGVGVPPLGGDGPREAEPQRPPKGGTTTGRLPQGGIPTFAADIGRRWRLARKDSDRAGWLLAHWGALGAARQMPWSKLQRLLTSEGIVELLALHDALAAVGEINPAEIHSCRERLALPPAELDPPPLVTGADLIALGVPRGKLYARLLEQLRDAQLDGIVTTKDDALELARRLWPEEVRSEG
jgi:poly(A) polymerase